MKSLMLFLQVVLKDIEDWCGVSTTRDLKTIARRVEHEGISFLTISLADFGKDFQKSLERKYVAPSDFAGFTRLPSGAFPKLLSGLLELVFDRDRGYLLDAPNVNAIWAIRQITLMWSKIELDCTAERTRKAYKQFIQTERDVNDWNKKLETDPVAKSLLARFERIGRLLWADCFSYVDNQCHEAEKHIYPKHGPGATAERVKSNDKWRFTEWTERLDEVFPVGEFTLPNWRYYEYLSDINLLQPGAERPVRVISVPKTLKTPRIIAIEPVCMQYVQQGLLAKIREGQQRFDTSRCFVGNEDQVPNRHMALRGSRDETLATLDLSEASDRVSNQLVRGLLRNHPHLAAGVDACRSRKADVPGYGVIRLAKFASMGSALTFAMEEMVFVTIIFMAIDEAGIPIQSKRDVMRFAGKVRVFGDDIIVPKEYALSVYSMLEAFGLRVNGDKTFLNGKFRESCGGDYYDGEDVSITKVRSLFPSDRRQESEIVRTVALRNNCYKAGLWRATAFLDGLLEGLIPFPQVVETSPVLGRHSYLGYETQKSCDRLHRPLVRGLVVDPDIPANPLDDRHALLKVLATAEGRSQRGEPLEESSHLLRDDWLLALLRGLPATEADHLAFAGRPHHVRTKVGWHPPY